MICARIYEIIMRSQIMAFRRRLTGAFLQHITVATRHRRKDERMIVIGGTGSAAIFRVPIVVDALPRVLLDVDVRLGHVPIRAEEVLHEQQRKLLGTADAVLLGQQIDGVLLRIGGHDVGVVT